ncbi:Organic solute transporter Ostalpha [Ceratobasidium sp. AG-Ba]|nr:Organic solute transporter Ostalpha [Ceratobasidium sp. AG-Ba]
MACPAHRAKQPRRSSPTAACTFRVRQSFISFLVDPFPAAHHVGWIVSGSFALVAVVASLWLIQKHAKWYSVASIAIYDDFTIIDTPPETPTAPYVPSPQLSPPLTVFDIMNRHHTPPLNGSNLLHYLPGPVPPPPPSHSRPKPRVGHSRGGSRSWHSHSRSGSHRTQEDIEESQPITSTSPSAETSHLSKAERRAVIHRVFHNIQMHPTPGSTQPTFKWIWPLGFVRARPRDGLRYLQWMKWGILQYCIVRPGSALAAVILQQFDLYCEASWGIRWGHVWMVVAVSISVTVCTDFSILSFFVLTKENQVAMYCLIQLYVTISQELKPYRPLLKLFSVKAVVFLTFWQGALLSGLASLNLIKDTEYMTAEDIVIGFAALLQTLEMMCFAFLHIKAFSYQPYKRLVLADPPPSALPAPTNQQFKNLGHAFDFTDTFKDIYSGILYHLGKGPSKEADDACRRGAGFREVFGRERIQPGSTGRVRNGGRVRERAVYGYRGVPTTDEQFTPVRPIRRPAPELLPTPQTSPIRDQPHGQRFSLDDPPPASVWRGQASVRPLPPGAYIPRLPGSPVPWNSRSGLDSQRPRLDNHRSRLDSQRSGLDSHQPRPVPLAMVTPPPTPLHRLRVEREIDRRWYPHIAAHLHPTFDFLRFRILRRGLLGIPFSQVLRGIHFSLGPRDILCSPSHRSTMQPDSARHTHSSVSPRSTLQPGSPRYTLYPDSARQTIHEESPRHTLQPDSPRPRVFSGPGPRSAETGYTGNTGHTVLETITGSGDTESTKSSSYRTAVDASSSRPGSVSTSTSGGRSSGTASYRTWERGVVRTGQVVVLDPDGQNGYRPRPSPPRVPETPDSESSRPDSLDSLLRPPSPPRPLRRVGPNIESRREELGARTHSQGPSIQPRTIVLPAPLSPARYPHSPWRTPAPPETHPVPWSLLQNKARSPESGVAGRAAGKGSVSEARILWFLLTQVDQARCRRCQTSKIGTPR